MLSIAFLTLRVINYLVHSITRDDMENIDDIADYIYEECLMKIKCLNNKGILGDYYADKEKKIIKKCKGQDAELLNEYHVNIYLKHLQINEMASARVRNSNKNYKTLVE